MGKLGFAALHTTYNGTLGKLGFAALHYNGTLGKLGLAALHTTYIFATYSPNLQWEWTIDD
ncbi:hypothetical protein B9T07_14910 [Limnospira fusiformis CCALA 023]